MIKAILIDNEEHCLDTLSLLLKTFCPQVLIADQCRSSRRGLEAIEKHKPDLIFLDIEMPVMNGFEMLEYFTEIYFAIIFTESYDQYAIKAIRFSALDYLLKPIDPDELIVAVQKMQERKKNPSAEQLEILLKQVNHNGCGFHKIAIPTAEGFELILADQVVRCEASDNYTQIFTKNGNKITACRSLKEMEEQMGSFSCFVRVHHSYLVNLNEIIKYVRGEGGYLVMSDGSTISVSRSRKEGLMKFF
jgi:two-component system LytT family response regulator